MKVLTRVVSGHMKQKFASSPEPVDSSFVVSHCDFDTMTDDLLAWLSNYLTCVLMTLADTDS